SRKDHRHDSTESEAWTYGRGFQRPLRTGLDSASPASRTPHSDACRVPATRSPRRTKTIDGSPRRTHGCEITSWLENPGADPGASNFSGPREKGSRECVGGNGGTICART